MEVTLDIHLLIDNELTADDFLTLYAIHKKGYKTLDKLNLKPDWDK